VIRRQVSIATSPRTVWGALTTGDGLGRWMGGTARVDAREGGRLTVERDGGTSSGLFHSFRPTARLELKWTEGPWKGSFTQFSVARDKNETVLNVLHSGGPLDDEQVATGVDGEWKRLLTQLRDGIEAG